MQDFYSAQKKRKMFVIISHDMDEKQKKQAVEMFKVEEFVKLPKELQKKWSNIPPEIENIEEYIKGIKEFLLKFAEEGDIVFVQGDYGATYSIVSFCKRQNLIPVYATTKRNVTEKKENCKTISHRVFEHVIFRVY